jgi:hypothetical protein
MIVLMPVICWNGQHDPDRQDVAHRRVEDGAQPAALGGQVADLGDLGLDIGVLADTAQDRAGLVLAALGDEPVRAFALEQHADEHQDRRDRGQGEHQPPVLGRGQAVVHEVGGEDAGGDGQLIEADQGAAKPRRGGLADIKRHDH